MDNKFIADTLLSHALYEYKELSDTWRDIERKAQGTIAGSGIFLAGISVAITVLKNPTWITISFFLLSILLLALSAIFSICALRVSAIDTIEDTGHVLIEAQKILVSESDVSDINTYLFNRVKKWQHASAALHDENNKKSKVLNSAHVVLVAAIFSTMLTLFVILSTII